MEPEVLPVFYYNDMLLSAIGDTIGLNLFEPRYLLMCQRLATDPRFLFMSNYENYRCHPGDVGFVVKITGLWPQARGTTFGVQGYAATLAAVCCTWEEPGTHGLHYAQYWPLDPKKVPLMHREAYALSSSMRENGWATQKGSDFHLQHAEVGGEVFFSSNWPDRTYVSAYLPSLEAERCFMACWLAALPALEKPRFTGPELLEVIQRFSGLHQRSVPLDQVMHDLHQLIVTDPQAMEDLNGKETSGDPLNIPKALWSQLLSELRLTRIFGMHVCFVRQVRLEPEAVKLRYRDGPGEQEVCSKTIGVLVTNGFNVEVWTRSQAAQRAFGKKYLRLITAKNRVLVDPDKTLEEAEMEDGECLTALVLQPQLAATERAFALWCHGDSAIVTWGNADFGGNSSAVQHQLKGVQHIQASFRAFAAILKNGSVITWGSADCGGNSSAVRDQLNGVLQIQATRRAFAAILEDGSVVTWGDAEGGGDSSAVQDQLKGVRQIQATGDAFAAILEDGSVVTWGDADDGGDSSTVQDQLKGVQQIQATGGAFAAILEDGSVVTWGEADCGSDSCTEQWPPVALKALPSGLEVPAPKVREHRSAKQSLVAKLLCRWWYVLPDWPPKDFDYTAALAEQGYRVVPVEDFESAAETEGDLRKVFALPNGYIGLYRDEQGSIIDVRPLEGRPSYDQLMLRSNAELHDLLLLAYQRQIEILESKVTVTSDSENVLQQLRQERMKAKNSLFKFGSKAAKDS
eukprot:symbB.v1.2.034528.t1/scaffold4473.1/size39787/1